MQEFVSHVFAVAVMISLFIIVLMPRKQRMNPVDDVMCEKHYHQLKIQITDCRNQYVLYRIFQDAQEFFDLYTGRVDQEKLSGYWDDLRGSIELKAGDLRNEYGKA